MGKLKRLHEAAFNLCDIWDQQNALHSEERAAKKELQEAREEVRNYTRNGKTFLDLEKEEQNGNSDFNFR